MPRESGVSDRPLPEEKAVAFRSPPELEVSIPVPHAGRVTGMGIPRGVTLIVGGGYHGKSTLLRALERGVYRHVRGDGREWVVTDPTAVKVRAEDGRRVHRVDISPFINNLPFGQDTREFSSENASGSTSQAANIIEALEAGCRLLLVDEDTSATNFMIRDRRMQALVAREKEPITPFIDRVRQLFEELGVSSCLVVGGSGDYLDVADTVIRMERYVPSDVTEHAREIARLYPTGRRFEAAGPWPPAKGRVPLPEGLEFTAGHDGRVKVGARGRERVRLGREEIDLSSVEQLVDEGQGEAIARMLVLARRYMDGRRTLAEVVRLVFKEVGEQGLDALAPAGGPRGEYVMPRPQELAAALNRLRTLAVVQDKRGRALRVSDGRATEDE